MRELVGDYEMDDKYINIVHVTDGSDILINGTHKDIIQINADEKDKFPFIELAAIQLDPKNFTEKGRFYIRNKLVEDKFISDKKVRELGCIEGFEETDTDVYSFCLHILESVSNICFFWNPRSKVLLNQEAYKLAINEQGKRYLMSGHIFYLKALFCIKNLETYSDLSLQDALDKIGIYYENDKLESACYCVEKLKEIFLYIFA